MHADPAGQRRAPAAPKPANASTGSEVSRPAAAADIDSAVADLGEHRSDADRGRPQVERRAGRSRRARGRRCGRGRGVESWLGQDRPHAAHRGRRASRPGSARRHAIAPGAPGRRPVAATRAMTVLHSTEPATSTSRCGARVDGPDRRRRRPGAVRRPHPGQAARDAAHPVRLPARPAAGGLGERRPGWPTRRAPAGQGRRAGGLAADGDGLARRRPARPCSTCWPAAAAAHRAASCASALPELAGTRRDRRPARSGAATSRSAPRVLTQLGAAATIVRGRNAGHWRPPGPPGRRCRRLARRRARAAADRGGVRRAGAALAAHVRPRHRDRPRVVAGLDHDAPCGARWPTSGRSRCPSTRRHRLGAARRRRRRSSPVEPWAALLPVLDPTTMGWKERDFYLDARPHAVPLRQQRQRRHDRLVERPDRRLLGPGRRRRRAGACCARTSAPTGAAALDAEAGAADRVAGRRSGSCSVYPSLADEVGPAAVSRRTVRARARPARAAGAARPAAADPLRQARPAPVHQPPRLQPGLRAGGLPGPGADGLLVGLQPAPPDLVRRRGADRVGQRGGVPRDRAGRGRRPGRRSRPRSTRRCPTGSTCSRSSSRPAARSPTCSRPATGGSTWPTPTPTQVDGGGRGVPRPPTRCSVERMTKKGLREFDCRAAVRRRCRPSRRSRALGWSWCCGTPCRPSAPTTCSPGWPPWPGFDAGEAPLLTRLAQGPLDETGDRSATRWRRRHDAAIRSRRVRYSQRLTR